MASCRQTLCSTLGISLIQKVCIGSSNSAYLTSSRWYPGTLRMTQLEGAGDALVECWGMTCLWSRVCKSTSHNTAATRPPLGLEWGLPAAFQAFCSRMPSLLPSRNLQLTWTLGVFLTGISPFPAAVFPTLGKHDVFRVFTLPFQELLTDINSGTFPCQLSQTWLVTL